MKIFSLQSKISLVGMSLIAGLVIMLTLLFFSQKIVEYGGCKKNDQCLLSFNKADYGWPYKFYDSSTYGFNSPQDVNEGMVPVSLAADFLFWSLVVFIILSMARHFRKKNYQIAVKSR